MHHYIFSPKLLFLEPDQTVITLTFGYQDGMTLIRLNLDKHFCNFPLITNKQHLTANILLVLFQLLFCLSNLNLVQLKVFSTKLLMSYFSFEFYSLELYPGFYLFTFLVYSYQFLLTIIKPWYNRALILFRNIKQYGFEGFSSYKLHFAKMS